MADFFLCNHDKIEKKLLGLIKTKSSEDGWDDYYIEKTNGDEWVLTSYHSEYNGGGVRVLKKLPPPSIQQLIEIALTAKDIDDISGASIELLEREKYHSEDFREELIKRMQLIEIAELSEFEKERINTIIYDSELFDPTNRKEILGKHWTEIKSDTDYYRLISEEAKNILNKIKKED